MDDLVVEIEDETLRDSDTVVEIESDEDEANRNEGDRVEVRVGQQAVDDFWRRQLTEHPRDINLWTEEDWERIFDEARNWPENHPHWLDNWQENHPTWRENLPDDELRIIDNMEDDWGAQPEPEPEVDEWEHFGAGYFNVPPGFLRRAYFDEVSSTRAGASPTASPESESASWCPPCPLTPSGPWEPQHAP